MDNPNSPLSSADSVALFQTLEKYWGYSALRGKQSTIIHTGPEQSGHPGSPPDWCR